MSLAGWDVAVSALQAEWTELEMWIESARAADQVFMVNGVTLTVGHIHWLASDVGDRIEQLPATLPELMAWKAGRDQPLQEAWSVVSSARLYAEMLRAMLTGPEVPDPAGMREAARCAGEVARMLGEIFAMLDAAAASPFERSTSGGAS